MNLRNMSHHSHPFLLALEVRHCPLGVLEVVAVEGGEVFRPKQVLCIWGI
jgi:hypothetical protein